MKSKIKEYLNSKTFGTGKKLLLILLVASAALPFQNCGPEPGPDPIDTTKPIDTTHKIQPINYFKFNGVELYNLPWDSASDNSFYKVNTDLTTVFIEGWSNDKTTKNEKINMILKFPGKALGSFKWTNDPKVSLEITITRNSVESQYIFNDQDPNKDMTISITKYDPVGGHIKGTFSGDLRFGITTCSITGGKFEAVRLPDEQ